VACCKAPLCQWDPPDWRWGPRQAIFYCLGHAVSLMKKYTQQTLTGQAGINLIEKRVLQMGWVWNATNIEAGIDGYIEIRDPVTGRATNIILQVQSKALSQFANETSGSLEYICSPRDLEYWLSGNAPVILIVSRPSSEEAYWAPIKDYFQTPALRRDRRVTFDKRRDKFDVEARDRLAQLAMPRYLGIYLTPPPRTETIYSNLLRVTQFPEDMYRASTDAHDGREIRRRLGWGSKAPDEWISKRKEVISFHSFDDSVWADIVEPGTADRFNTSEWALSDEKERVNEFLELMFRSLKSKLRPLGVSYYRDGDYFYFTASPDLQPRKIDYKSFKKSTTRTIFQGFPSKDDPTHIRFYRHTAFGGQFLRFDGIWYLAITPTYHFTFDGWQRHKWYESKLKGIKALEKNAAVLGQVAMWAALLREQPAGLFSESVRSRLSFGDLMSDQLEAGINEDWWLWNEEDDSTKRASSELPELPLLPLEQQEQSS